MGSIYYIDFVLSQLKTNILPGQSYIGRRTAERTPASGAEYVPTDSSRRLEEYQIAFGRDSVGAWWVRVDGPDGFIYDTPEVGNIASSPESDEQTIRKDVRVNVTLNDGSIILSVSTERVDDNVRVFTIMNGVPAPYCEAEMWKQVHRSNNLRPIKRVEYPRHYIGEWN